MGPDNKDKLKSPAEIQATAQDTAILVAESSLLVERVDELLKRATKLVEDQQALVEALKSTKKK